ncbi:MAG: hypothetical protein F6K26_28100 [Moorea sp. SIO2I5]|nr:hypothetical protein [Moorena sp. SIO2I5]
MRYKYLGFREQGLRSREEARANSLKSEVGSAVLKSNTRVPIYWKLVLVCR